MNLNASLKSVAITAIFTALAGCASVSDYSHSGLGRAAGQQAELSAKDQARVCRETGLGLAASERDAHAVAQLKKARELDPQIRGLAHPLAVLYDRQGQFGLAEQEYRRAMAEQTPNANLLNDFAYFRYTQGRHDEARMLLNRALKQNPEHDQAAINLAMVNAAEGDFEAAFRLFEDSVGVAAAHQNIGLLLLRSGRESDAVTHLENARSLDPSLQAARSALTQVSQSASTEILPASHSTSGIK